MGFLSDLFSSEQTTESSSSSTSQLNPWARANPALEGAMGWIDNAVGGPAWSPYGGQQVAGFNPMQQQGFNAVGNWFGGQGMQGANALNQYGLQGLQSGGAASNYYQGLLGQDPAQRAGQLANNPYMTGMVDAASRDITRNLGENIIPGIAGSSYSSGNLGSSRRGAAEAIAARGAADRIGDISANLRGSAYDNMLSRVMGQQGQAAQGLQNQAQMGANALTQGQNLFGQNYNTLMGAGGMQQQNQQQLLNAAMNNYYMGQQMPLQQAQAMYGLASNPAVQFGQQTGTQQGTQTTSQSQNPYGALLNMGAQVGAGMMTGGMNPFAGIGSAVGGLFGGSGAQMNPGGWNNAMSNINLFE